MKKTVEIILILLVLTLLVTVQALAEDVPVLNLPLNLKTIGEQAFYQATSLNVVVVPDGATRIEEKAFAYSSLQEITLPRSLTSIAEDAFEGCEQFKVNVPMNCYAYNWCMDHGYISRPDTTPSEYFTYTTINGLYAQITGYTGADQNVVVPEEIDDYIIQKLADNTFKNNKSIEYVYLPNTITEIGSSAFYGCTSLLGVDIGTAVEKIGAKAFYGCSSLIGVVFPETLTTTGSELFRDCINLEFFDYPINWETAGANTITGCSKISKLIIPAGAKKVPVNAFSNCKNITEIEFSNTLEQICKNAFSKCTGLQCVDIPGNVKYISGFDNCINLITINIDEGPLSVDAYAFDNCKSLSTVTIPGTIQNIGNNAFSNCSNIQNITFTNGLQIIGQWAFYGCSSLTSAILPDSVTSIGREAFRNCKNLSEFHYPLGLTTIDYVYTFSKDSYVFAGCEKLRRIVIPDGVTTIAGFVFDHADYLRYVELPSTVTEIGTYSFAHCTAITELNFPVALEKIGMWAFIGCTNLKSAILPDTVISIGREAFRDCKNLSEFHYPLSLNTIDYVYTFSKDSYIFAGCEKLTRIVVPEGVTTIAGFVFDHADYLRHVELSSTVKEIGTYSFAHCTAITNLEFPVALEKIGMWAFIGCTNLSSAILPDTVTSIGREAFRDCKNLSEFHYPLSLNTIDYVYTFSKDSYIFSGCELLKEITIPDGVISIPVYVFDHAEYIERVVLPSSVTSIGAGAFCACSRMTYIYMGYNINSIGENAFKDCTNLTIWTEYGSYALQYAISNKIAYYYLTPDGVNSPSGTLYQGDSYGLHGYARASIPLTDVTATIWNNDKSQVLQTISVNPATTDYSLTDVINYHLIFGTLPLGTYHYTLHAATDLSEETWADTTFKIVPQPLRIFISNLSLPYGLESTDYSIGGTIVSNYPITQVKAILYRSDSDEVVKNITVSPNSITYDLVALSGQLSLASYTNETLSIKIAATSNDENRTLIDTDLSLRTSANIVLNERKNQTLIDFANDSDNRDIFTTEYVDAVIDDMSWVEDGIVLMDNVLSISIFERIENLLIYNGNRQDLIELYKKEIVQLIEDGAYERFNIAGTASKYSKDLLSILKSEGKLTKEAFKDFKNTKMENFIGSVNSLIGAVKDGLSTAKDLEEAYETIAAICGNFETGLYVLEYIGSSANIASRDEFNEALNILRTEYVSTKAAVIYEHLKIIQDLILEYGEDQIKDALTDLLSENFGLDFSVALPKLFAKLTMKATGLDEVASTYKKLFVRQDLLNIANNSYKQAFNRVHNGDHSDEALLELASAISITKAAWVRANDLITTLPRYAYTVGNDYLHYRYTGRISILLTSSDYD